MAGEERGRLHSDGIKAQVVSMEDIPLSENGSANTAAVQGNGGMAKKEKRSKALADVDKANCWSFITFSWITRLMIHAYRKGIHMCDMPPCAPVDKCEANTIRLEDLWLRELRTRGPKEALLRRAVWRFTWARVMMSMTCFLFCIIAGFLTPTIFMRKLLDFVEDNEASLSTGILWAVGLVVMDSIRIVLATATWAISNRTAVRLQAACLGLLYKKSLCLSHLSESAVGELTSLFSNDGQRLVNAVTMGPLIVGGPVTAVFGCIYILYILSPWAACGLVVFLLYYPLQYFLSRAMGRMRQKIAALTDQRVQLIHEAITYIRVIKMYTWEECFQKKIMGLRNKERKWLEKTGLIQSMSLAMAPAIPSVAAIVTFLAHTGAGYSLTAAQGFSVIALLVGRIRPTFVFLRAAVQSLAEMSVALRRLQAFVTILFYYILAFSIRTIPYAARDGFEGFLALRRVQKFLMMPELRQRVDHPIDRSQAICLNQASFTWEVEAHGDLKPKSDDPAREQLQVNASLPADVLHDLDLAVAKGQLIGICGVVGSGKSALMRALLGQLKLTAGRMAVEGSCAYMSQEAWVLNASVRDNILFGEQFESTRYYSTVSVCALNQDMAVLPSGDQTEVGEQGTNLSGGQRQRVALARAVYANKDIYLLDDPLSAVDMHVAQHIIDKCILGSLIDKTVILVTSQPQDGHIIAHGSHDSLMKENADYAALVEMGETNEKQLDDTGDGEHSNLRKLSGDVSLHHGSTCRSRSLSQQISRTSVNTTTTCGSSKLDLTEEDADGVDALPPRAKEAIATGSISWRTYIEYVKAGGGVLLAMLVIMVVLMNVGSAAFSNWWLSIWLKAGDGGQQHLICLAPNMTLAEANQTYFESNGTAFDTNGTEFETNGMAVEANQTESEVNQTHVDTYVSTGSIGDNPDLSYYQLVYGLTIVAILATSVLRSFMCMKVTLKASSSLHNQLLDKLLRCPVRFFDLTPIGVILSLFSHDMDEMDVRLPLTEEQVVHNIWVVFFALLFICIVFPWFLVALVPFTIIFVVVRTVFRVAVRDLKRLEIASRSPLFSHVSASVQGVSTIKAFRKERLFLSRFTSLLDAYTVPYYLQRSSFRWLGLRLDVVAVAVSGITATIVLGLKGVVPAALMGLALSYSQQLTGVFQYSVRLCAECEASFAAVERVHRYVHDTDQEGEGTNPGPAPKGWPRKGRLTFKDVVLKYGDGGAALDGVSMDIGGGEKVGVVGRTGAGKTSLVAAVTRACELSGGEVKVDGVDVAVLTLDQLRRGVGVVPQEPVLFAGTLRWNLDPENRHSDSDMWSALVEVGLKEKVQSMEGGLESVVQPKGENFSAGEKQLICLARAMLRPCKVLFLDEPTSCVDTETDAMMQQAIQRRFKDCTVVTIAHRVASVLGCNRVAVMEAGKLVEFDKPSILQADPRSHFSKLIAQAKGNKH